jgi:PAS domain S-box-containing protein
MGLRPVLRAVALSAGANSQLSKATLAFFSSLSSGGKTLEEEKCNTASVAAKPRRGDHTLFRGHCHGGSGLRSGEITHYLAIQQDITEQKQDKEALAESEARFRQVAEMAGEWLWEQDPEGHYLYSSGAVRDILGFTPLEIRGKYYLDLLTAEDRKHWTAAADIRQPFHSLVNRYRHKDGHVVYTESTGAPIFDEQGKLIKWRGVDHDITARKAFEDALRVRDRARSHQRRYRHRRGLAR